MTVKYQSQNFEKIIEDRLKKDVPTLKESFEKSVIDVGTRYTFIEHLLPEEEALRIFKGFEASGDWREMKSFREKKLTSKNFDSFPPILGEITFALQSRKVLDIIEEITGIENQVPDPSLYAGGLSLMRPGDYLEPHIDNSHDQTRKVYRRLNLLYYVTPEWKLEDGGHLELWNKDLSKKVTIESRFNRLVLMETHHLSWHSVSKVQRQDGKRCCVSNYNFSKQSPLEHEYYHVTSFAGRPENPGKKWLFKADNLLRSGLRALKRDGFGKKDLYEGSIQK